MSVSSNILQVCAWRGLMVCRGKHRHLCFAVSVAEMVITLELAMCALAAVGVLGRKVDVMFIGGGGREQLQDVGKWLDSGNRIWRVKGEI